MLSERQTEILVKLAKYRYLSPKQMIQLKIRTHRTNLYPDIKKLCDIGFIEKKKYSFTNDTGQLEDLIYLTPKGAKALVNNLRFDPEEIKLGLVTKRSINEDYIHKKETINFQILFDQWLEYNSYKLEFFDTYFEKVKSNGRSKVKTRIDFENKEENRQRYIIPDAVGKFRTHEKNYIFQFEYHRNRETRRALDQLKKHFLCYAVQAPNRHFNFMDQKIPLYYVIEEENYLEHIRSGLKKIDPDNLLERIIYFTTTKKMKENFWDCWISPSGKPLTFIDS